MPLLKVTEVAPFPLYGSHVEDRLCHQMLSWPYLFGSWLVLLAFDTILHKLWKGDTSCDERQSTWSDQCRRRFMTIFVNTLCKYISYNFMNSWFTFTFEKYKSFMRVVQDDFHSVRLSFVLPTDLLQSSLAIFLIYYL